MKQNIITKGHNQLILKELSSLKKNKKKINKMQKIFDIINRGITINNNMSYHDRITLQIKIKQSKNW